MRELSFHRGKVGIAALLGLALVATPVAAAPVLANPAGTGVVISEAYLNGGSAGAAFTNKFVELYNPTAASIDLSGSSLQYRAAANVNAPTLVFPLTGSIPAGGYYLAQGASNGAAGLALPTPDATIGLNPSGTSGQIFFANQTTALAAIPAGSATGNSTITDLIGYGAAVTYEGTAATAASLTTSLQRVAGIDSDNNAADFGALAPTPTNAAGDTTAPVVVPTDPVDATIEQVQGSTDTSPYANQYVTTDGVVTAAYPTGGFAGYYIQTTGTGGAVDVASHTTSSGLFIYSPNTVASFPAIGTHVEVTGLVSEFQGTTELTVSSAADVDVIADDAATPAPAAIAVPLTASGRESFEGMLIAPTGQYTITDNYDTNYYGSIVLNPGPAPLQTPTAVVEPGQAAIDYLAANVARAITLDDGSSLNFNSTANKNTKLPYLSTSAPVRIGAAVTFSRPVILEYRFNAWNFQPRQQLTFDNAGSVQPAYFENSRTSAPKDLGGDITLASFNVLNYFTTTGDQLAGCEYYTDKDGNPVTVADGCDARGAANAASLERQQAKIVAAINGLGADVVSLEEIENSVKFGKNRDDALAKLVAALNAAPGFANTWEYVPSPAVLPANQDVIRTAFIYKKALVAPVGTSVINDDPAFASAARQPLAQQFQLATSNTGDTRFVVIVNHFKSKGSGEGDNADKGDGQGASNADRVAQAKALVAFASAITTNTGVGKVFLTGDFNSYLKEDPIDVLVAAGYTDLGSTTGKSTYAFDGAVGSLDHIFASTAAAPHVAAVDVWNINSVESIALEYSRYNYNALDLYQPNAFRSSDHDPILVGLNLRETIGSNLPKIVGDNKVGATLKVRTGTWDPRPVKLSYRWLNDGKAIKGATGKSYKLKKSDKGDRISVRVTGSKSGYETVIRTSKTVKVYLALKATPKPKITGTAKVGKTLSVTAGKWKPVKVTLKYQWYRNGVAIKGADEKKHKLVKADKGKKITIKVTGSKKGYLSESETRSIARIK